MTQLIPYTESGLAAIADQHAVALKSTERKMLDAAARKRVQDYGTQELVEELKAFIPALCRDLGMQRAPDQYDQTRFFQTITDHYADLTLSDIKVAFEMHMLGDLDKHYGDRKPHHYQMFSFEFYTTVLRAYRQELREVQVRVSQDINSSIKLLAEHEVNPGIGKYGLLHLVKQATREYYVSGEWDVLINPAVVRMLQRLELVPENLPPLADWDLADALRAMTRRMSPVVQHAEKRRMEEGGPSEEVKARASVVQVRRMALTMLDALTWEEVEERFDELEQVVVDRYKLTDREKEQALEAFSALEGEDPAEGGQAPEAHADEA